MTASPTWVAFDSNVALRDLKAWTQWRSNVSMTSASVSMTSARALLQSFKNQPMPIRALGTFLFCLAALGGWGSWGPGGGRIAVAQDAENDRFGGFVVPSELGDPARMIEDLRFLTSDKLQGRSSVEPTIEIAADYLAKRFQDIGLRTDLFDGKPFQMVDISIGPRPSSFEANQLEISFSDHSKSQADPAPQSFKLGQAFNPLAIGSLSGTVEAPLVWVGYGINSEKHQYNDYAGIDVDGKIAIMLRKEPGVADPDSPFNGVKNTRHAFFDTKVATAIDAGAAAVIIVNDAGSIERKVAEINGRQEAERVRIKAIQERLEALPVEAVNIRKKIAAQIVQAKAMVESTRLELRSARQGVLEVNEAGTNPRGGEKEILEPGTGEASKRGPVPVVSVSREIAGRLIRSARTPSFKADGQGESVLDQIAELIDSDFQPRSFEIEGAKARIQVDLMPSVFKSPNVVATLPGAGTLAEETVVIGAHYDHVGMGGFGSLAPGTVAIHNGADDNASGTAVLLQVAQRLVGKFADQEIERFADREIEEPPIQENRRRLVFIAFTGEERGLLGSKHYVQQPRFPITNTVAMINMDMVGRLNDNELTVYGTQSATVMDGVLDQANRRLRFKLDRIGSGYGPSDHASFYAAGVPVLFFFTGLHSDYHRPSDDFEKLNLDGMDRITDMITQVSERLATMPERPVHKQTEDNVQIRRQLTVFMGVKLSQQPGEVVFSSILGSGPAEASGLIAGDRLVSIAGKPVSQMEEVFKRLRRYSPGDAMPLVVKRKGETVEIEVKLRAR